jgi:hypothetical protein
MVPRVSMVLLHGIKMDALEKVSIMVSMESNPSDKGNFTTKSRAIDMKGA